MSDAEDAERKISAAIEKSNETAGSIGSAKETAGQLGETLESAGIEDRAATAAEARDQVEEAQAAQGQVRQLLDEARALVELLRGATASAPAPASSPPPPPQTPPFKPMRTDPVKRDEIVPHVGKDYAVATLWDADGRKVVGIHSADNDGPAAAAKWRPPWRDYHRLRRHVEAHAAARMRRDGHKTMAMYINLPACRYPDGCEKNLRDLIPEGSTLWVHWVKPSGTVKATPYRGTGRALDD